MTGANANPKFLHFKEVAGGYIFRAPKLGSRGQPAHYLVDQTQKDQIEAIEASIPPRRVGYGLIAWFVLCLLVLVASVNSMSQLPSLVVVAMFVVGMLLVPFLGLRYLVNRQREQMRPILSQAKLTDQVISNEEILAAASLSTSLKQTWVSALSLGTLSLVQVEMMAVSRNPKVAMFSDANMLPWVLQFVAYGLLAMVCFKATLDKIDMAVPSAPAPPSFLRAPSRTVVLAVATIMVGVVVMLLIITW